MNNIPNLLSISLSPQPVFNYEHLWFGIEFRPGFGPHCYIPESCLYYFRDDQFSAVMLSIVSDKWDEVNDSIDAVSSYMPGRQEDRKGIDPHGIPHDAVFWSNQIPPSLDSGWGDIYMNDVHGKIKLVWFIPTIFDDV